MTLCSNFGVGSLHGTCNLYWLNTAGSSSGNHKQLSYVELGSAEGKCHSKVKPHTCSSCQHMCPEMFTADNNFLIIVFLRLAGCSPGPISVQPECSEFALHLEVNHCRSCVRFQDADTPNPGHPQCVKPLPLSMRHGGVC